MTSEIIDINSVNVDVIVYLIKNMSHAMFYKVINNNRLSDLKTVIYNGKNVELLYGEMYQTLKNIQ